MNFERGQEVKKALGIGIEEQIKSDIIGILPSIMNKYVHEFRTDELSEMIAYEIKEWTGHKVKIDWLKYCKENNSTIKETLLELAEKWERDGSEDKAIDDMSVCHGDDR